MKKITLLCFLAMGSSVATWAEVGDKITKLEQLSNNKCYTIQPQDNGRGTWTTNDADPGYLYSTVKTGESVNDTESSQQFAFIKSASGKYYAYNIGSQKFLSYTPDKGQTVALVSELLSNDAEVTFVSTTAEYKNDYPWVVALNGHHVGISNGESYPTGIITHYPSTADGGNCISITEAGDFEPTAALAQIAAFEAVNTEENRALVAEANQILSIPQYAVGGYNPELWKALSDACGENKIADINDVGNKEFKEALQAIKEAGPTGEMTFSNDKVYQIVCKTTSLGNLIARTNSQSEDEHKQRIFATSKSTTDALIENSDKWQVYTDHGYTVLYNQGTDSYAKTYFVTTTGSDGKPITTQYWELNNEQTAINIQSNQEQKGIGAFTIQDKNSIGQYQYMHVNNGYDTGVVGWETVSDNTNFYFVELPGVTAEPIDLSSTVLPLIKAEAKQLLDKNVTDKENYLGYFDQQTIQALQNIYDDTEATIDNLEKAINDVKASSKKPEATKYYYIQNTMAFDDGQTKAIYENPDGSNIAWNTVAQGPAELWQFEDAGNGKYYIKSANTGKYIKLNPGTTDGCGSLVTEKNSAFTLEQKDNSITLGLINYINNDYATLVLQTNNTWGSGSVAKPEDVSGNYVGTYNEFSDARPTRWNVIEANSVKITISDAKYATIWLPYAVNLNEKVEAYTIGSITNGYATLKKIEGNVIPAQTAAILYATAGTYEFTIAADNTLDAIKSDLQGTAIRTEVDANVNAYILGNVEGKVGFYQMSDGDRAIAGNKAYLVLPAAQSNIRSIIIGGPTTGIEDTVAEGTEAEEYYDLQGRRVMNPTKGIYVTKSGKKVVFNK